MQNPKDLTRELQIRSAARLPVDRWDYNSDFVNEYEIMHKMGSGASAQVYVVRQKKTNKLFAAKVMTDSEIWVANELYILEFLSKTTNCVASGVLCHYGHFLISDPADPLKRIPVILTDFVDGQDLYDYIRSSWVQGKSNISTDVMKKLLKSCLEALLLIHSLGIAHRDIKPENIMVLHAEPRCVLIDFAFACKDSQCVTAEFATTPCYTSFDRFAKYYTKARLSEKETLAIDQSGDLWALGLSFYQLLTGQNSIPCMVADAFDDAETPRQYSMRALAKFVENYFIFPHEKFVENDPALDDVIRGLVEPVAEKRLTAAQALDVLNELDSVKDIRND